MIDLPEKQGIDRGPAPSAFSVGEGRQCFVGIARPDQDVENLIDGNRRRFKFADEPDGAEGQDQDGEGGHNPPASTNRSSSCSSVTPNPAAIAITIG